MKRVASQVALETITYVMPHTQRVKVVDYDTIAFNLNDTEHTRVIYEGELLGWDWRVSSNKDRAMRSAVRHMEVIDGVLVLGISTRFEQY